ncbi:MAG TPA: endolytic transglycosylase MltG [Candidatus Merdivicinus intestinavium]|nr:endolytic transglycosylase MltG [Candidatus Merdivicinus intestinavium]
MDEDRKNGQETDWVDELLQEVAQENADAESEPQAPPEEPQAAPPPPPAQPPEQPRRAAKSPAPKRRRPKRVRVRRVGITYSIIYIAVVLALCGAATIFCMRAAADVLAISQPDVAVEIEIPEGTDVEELSHILKDAGVIQYPWMFQLVAQYEGIGEIASGTFVVNRNMGYTSLMNAVEKGNAPRETVTVTIPEGLNINEIAEILEENGVCSATVFTRAVGNTDFSYDFVSEIPDDDQIYYHLEGYLFPDTYEFYTGDSALNVISRMMSNFQSKISEVSAQINASGMSLHEVITLASIIQAEAPDAENMAMVSSVYHNRLNNPAEFPRMESDPTRNYANEVVLSDSSVASQQRADAYNTYTSEGLPPGPINNPGMDAINAALNPAESSYYYFCSDLNTREFFYAETLAEHEQNLYRAHLR